MLKILLRTGPLLLAASVLRAGPCFPDTLANYQALPPAGCTIGAVSFSGFGFSSAAGGGAVAIGASSITVTPQSGIDIGLAFTSGGFSVSGTGFVSYVITYTEDPDGDIRSLDDVLDDPTSSPGVGRVDSLGCLGASFSPTCPTSTVSVSVFDDGTPGRQLTNAVNFFPGVQILGVQHTISLDGHGSGSVVMNGFSGASIVPEPASGWVAALALVLGLVLARKARLKRQQVRLQHGP